MASPQSHHAHLIVSGELVAAIPAVKVCVLLRLCSPLPFHHYYISCLCFVIADDRIQIRTDLVNPVRLTGLLM